MRSAILKGTVLYDADVGEQRFLSPQVREKVQHQRRRLQNECGWGLVPKVQDQLHADPRAYRRRRAGKTTADGAMNMTARNPLDLGVLADNARKLLSSGEDLFVHVTDAGSKRWVVHEYERGRIRFFGKNPVQPGKPSGIQTAAMLSRYNRVEADQAHGEVFNGVADSPFPIRLHMAVQVAMLGKKLTEAALVIVVPRNHEKRRFKRREDSPQDPIGFECAFVHEITGNQNRIRNRLEMVDVFDGSPQGRSGLRHTIREDAFGLEMKIGNLSDQHKSHGSRVNRAPGSIATSTRCPIVKD